MKEKKAESKETLEKDISKFVDDRVNMLRDQAIAKNKQKSYGKQVKELQKHLDGIDRVMQEKVDELNGKSEKKEEKIVPAKVDTFEKAKKVAEKVVADKKRIEEKVPAKAMNYSV